MPEDDSLAILILSGPVAMDVQIQIGLDRGMTEADSLAILRLSGLVAIVNGRLKVPTVSLEMDAIGFNEGRIRCSLLRMHCVICTSGTTQISDVDKNMFTDPIAPMVLCKQFPTRENIARGSLKTCVD